MADGGKIIAGLVVFVGLVTYPFWITLAEPSAARAPTLEKPVSGDHCVESKPYMRAFHMDLLNEWRDRVVREGKHMTASRDFPNDLHEMSLTGTCLKCHADKTAFCDRCHGYVGVSPYCWDCHNDPKGSR